MAYPSTNPLSYAMAYSSTKPLAHAYAYAPHRNSPADIKTVQRLRSQMRSMEVLGQVQLGAVLHAQILPEDVRYLHPK